MAFRVVGNLYKHSALPQLRQGAVTCRIRQFLQMMDAQSSRERWEKPQGQELGCSWRWANVRFLPCRAVSHSADFVLTLPLPLLLCFWGRKWNFPAAMLLWLDACIAIAFWFFHLISARLCGQMTTIFYLQPHQGAAHPQQVPQCQHPTSMAALSLGSQPPGSHLHKLLLHHSETMVLLWGILDSTTSSSFSEIWNRGLKVLPHLLFVFFMEQALEESGRLTCEKQNRLCFNPTFLWLSLRTARRCSSAWSLFPELLSQN